MITNKIVHAPFMCTSAENKLGVLVASVHDRDAYFHGKSLFQLNVLTNPEYTFIIESK